MLFKGRNIAIKFFDDYGSMIPEFRKRAIKEKRFKILTPQQMLKRSPIALVQVKSRNIFKNLLNEIPQLMYSFYQAREITKKVYNNIVSSIKLENRIVSILMNSENIQFP